MAIVRYTYDPANPPKLTAEQRARLDAMTEEQIEANALSDPDNPPLTDAELATAYRPGDIRSLRQRLGLTQSGFAETFGVNLRTLQEWSRGGARRIRTRDPICASSARTRRR